MWCLIIVGYGSADKGVDAGINATTPTPDECAATHATITTPWFGVQVKPTVARKFYIRFIQRQDYGMIQFIDAHDLQARGRGSMGLL